MILAPEGSALRKALVLALAIAGSPKWSSAISVGVSLRQQVTPRGVLDLGVLSDLPADPGMVKGRVRAIVGYSASF